MTREELEAKRRELAVDIAQAEDTLAGLRAQAEKIDGLLLDAYASQITWEGDMDEEEDTSFSVRGLDGFEYVGSIWGTGLWEIVIPTGCHCAKGPQPMLRYCAENRAWAMREIVKFLLARKVLASGG